MSALQLHHHAHPTKVERTRHKKSSAMSSLIHFVFVKKKRFLCTDMLLATRHPWFQLTCSFLDVHPLAVERKATGTVLSMPCQGICKACSSAPSGFKGKPHANLDTSRILVETLQHLNKTTAGVLPGHAKTSASTLVDPDNVCFRSAVATRRNHGIQF